MDVRACRPPSHESKAKASSMEVAFGSTGTLSFPHSPPRALDFGESPPTLDSHE